MSIQSTLSISSFKLSDSIRDRILESGSFTTVTENDPSTILPISLGLICLDGLFSSQSLSVTHIGIIKKNNRVSTGQVRLRVTDIVELPRPVSMEELEEKTPSKSMRSLKQAFSVGYKKVDSLTGGRLKIRLEEVFPSLVDEFKRFERKINGVNLNLNAPRVQDAAVEKDALGLALDIFGVDRRTILSSWQIEDDKFGNSFLVGLKQYSAYEDDIINRDLRTLPGMVFEKEEITGVAEFKNSFDEKMIVINANRKPLEKATGVDLIYFHRQYEAFTFVQYKMMSKPEGSGKSYYNPNERSHREEIVRLNSLAEKISTQKWSETLPDYRISTCPIFFKLCGKILFKQNDGSITPGAYIPLDQWNILLSDDSTKGPLEGRQIGYHNLNRRYVGTQTFTELVQRGLIGTQSHNSKMIALFIEDALKNGHSVLYAIDESLRREDDNGETQRYLYP